MILVLHEANKISTKDTNLTLIVTAVNIPKDKNNLTARDGNQVTDDPITISKGKGFVMAVGPQNIFSAIGSVRPDWPTSRQT